MSRQSFTVPQARSFFIQATTALFLILIFSVHLLAQYKGAPVKKARLIQALRSRQLQTRDIVTIINRNGVDFRLTPETRKSLVAAGARPEVINAVANNPRPLPQQNENSAVAKVRKNNSARRASKPTPAADYDDLLEQAIFSYKEQRNPKGAIRFLESAVKMNPDDPAAYQMLGFVYLYGLNDAAGAEKAMRASIANGGSAVFRVFHDDNGKFTDRCAGSLFISGDTLRFESDDNIHTFETTTVNIDKIKLDTETTRVWKKHSVFKIFLKIGSDKAKFRFAPVTGLRGESEMVARFLASSTLDVNSVVSSLITID
jgi:tetratricopeptide (TPR) repeat protein